MKIFTKDGHLNVPEEAVFQAMTPNLQAEPKHLVKQAYCQSGHPLIAEENIHFNGYPGIELYLETDDNFDIVTISPYLGDAKKAYDIEFKHKELVRICCPHCMNELPVLAPHDCRDGAQFVALFLNEHGDINDSVGICTAWGCHSAFLESYGEIICRVRYDSIIPSC